MQVCQLYIACDTLSSIIDLLHCGFGLVTWDVLQHVCVYGEEAARVEKLRAFQTFW